MPVTPISFNRSQPLAHRAVSKVVTEQIVRSDFGSEVVEERSPSAEVVHGGLSGIGGTAVEPHRPHAGVQRLHQRLHLLVQVSHKTTAVALDGPQSPRGGA